MNGWEKHRNLLIVAAAFLFLLFLEWLFYLRGCGNEVERLDVAYKKKISKDIEELANSNNVSKVADMLQVYQQKNEELNNHIESVQAKMEFSFPDPLIPEGQFPQSYVRQRLREEQNFFAQQLASVRQIELTDQALTLGMVLPDDVTEDRETDYEWTRQVLVLHRVCEWLMALKQSNPNVPVVLTIHTIRPLTTQKTGQPAEYLWEYPVELELDISLEGISQLLQKASDPKTLQVIRKFGFSSDPATRRTRYFREVDQKAKKIKIKCWNYYRVKLVCATAVPFSAKDRKKASEEAKRAQSRKRAIPAKPIPH